MKWILLLAVVAMFGVTACHSEKEQEKLEKTQWHLKTLYGEDVKLKNPKDSMFIYFDLEEKRVNGRAVCNRFFGRFEINESELKFSSMGATRMVCEDAQKEEIFFQMLEQVDSFVVEKQILYFFSDKKEIASFQMLE